MNSHWRFLYTVQKKVNFLHPCGQQCTELVHAEIISRLITLDVTDAEDAVLQKKSTDSKKKKTNRWDN